MRFEIGPGPRDPVFLKLAQSAADEHDDQEHKREPGLFSPRKTSRNQETGGDEQCRLAQEGEHPRNDEQCRTLASVERFVNPAIERPASPKEHDEPQGSERDQRARETQLRCAKPDR